MLAVMPESQGKVLAVQASGKLTDKDYTEILIPRLAAIIKDLGKARFLYYMDESFEGWTTGALWDDAKFGLKHKNDFEKLAVVGAGKWVEWGTKLSARIMAGEVRTFPRKQLSEALQWIQAA